MPAIFRAAFGYFLLILMIRTAGRRPGKQLTPYEFLFVFFVGGLALTPMVGNDRSISNALCIIATIGACHFGIAWLKQKSPRFSRLVDGVPLVLLNKGEWQVDTMRRMRLTDDDIMAMARDKGLERLDQIEYAILERNGEISIIQKD